MGRHDPPVLVAQSLPPHRGQDGRPGELKTLTDARALIQSLPESRRQQPAWQHAAMLLLRAAGSRAPQDITHVTAQLYRALLSEGWL